MKKCIVITSIATRPTLQVQTFARLKDWDLIVVGDKKNSIDINGNEWKGIKFLSFGEHYDIDPLLHETIRYNHYARKNFGYLYAMREGYEIIAESDDDNQPYAHWGQLGEKQYQVISGPSYPNMYYAYGISDIWPRGYPLSWIKNPPAIEFEPACLSDKQIWVEQGLVDNDPDVDALYRLTHREGTKFEYGVPVALNKGVYSAFNSQNTIWKKRAFKYLYLPSSVSPRYTDILRSYIAQFLMHKAGGYLGFVGATAVQKRNEHDLLKDLAEEMQMYADIPKLIPLLEKISSFDGIDPLINCYEQLYSYGIVGWADSEGSARWCQLVDKALEK